MSGNDGNISIGQELSEQLTLHKNLQQVVLVTTTDKVRLCLLEHQTHLSKANDWVAPAGVVIAAIATLCAADFKSFIFDASVWKALFIITAIGSTMWLVRALISLWKGRKHRGIDQVLETLAANSATSVPSVTPQVGTASLKLGPTPVATPDTRSRKRIKINWD